jgi:hypothetical protein
MAKKPTASKPSRWVGYKRNNNAYLPNDITSIIVCKNVISRKSFVDFLASLRRNSKITGFLAMAKNKRPRNRQNRAVEYATNAPTPHTCPITPQPALCVKKLFPE